MQRIHPFTALLTVIIMAGVAEAAIRKERSLAITFVRALGG